MNVSRNIIAFILSVTKDMNPKLNIARSYIVYTKSKNKSDKKHMEDLLNNNEYFKTEQELIHYYNRKIIQVKEYWNTLNETDRIEAFTDSESCRGIFGDIIKDDSFMKERTKDD